jgi:hypothetical protein
MTKHCKDREIDRSIMALLQLQNIATIEREIDRSIMAPLQLQKTLDRSKVLKFPHFDTLDF